MEDKLDWAMRFLIDRAESWLSSVNENADTDISTELHQNNAIAIRKMATSFNHILDLKLNADEVLDIAAQNLFGCNYSDLRR